MVFNNYGNGTDDSGHSRTASRIHTDDSIEVRYYNKPENTGISKMAFSFTGDLGCEYGGGVTCHGAARRAQSRRSWAGCSTTGSGSTRI